MTVHFNMKMSDYLAAPQIGSSTLKHIMQTPADFKAALEQKFSDTRATILGTAVHCLLLEPHLFESQYALQPEEWGPKNVGEGRKKWDAFKKENQGKIILDYETALFLNRLKKAANEHPMVSKIAKDAKFEVTAFAKIQGVDLKARIDILCHNCIWDLKTVGENIDDENLFKIVFSNGYHFQGAHHTAVISAHDEYKNVQSYGWIFVSTTTPAPHIRIVKAPKELISWSQADHKYALNKLKQCLQSNLWEGYPAEISELTIPEWARKIYA